MGDAHDRVAQHHARTCPAHHDPHLLAHVGPVTMNDAVRAGGLRIAKYASLQAPRRVVEQSAAVAAKRRAALVAVSAATHAYPGFDGFERARATHEAFVGDELNDRHGHGEQERIPYSRRPWFRCSWLVFGREPDDGFEATPEH